MKSDSGIKLSLSKEMAHTLFEDKEEDKEVYESIEELFEQSAAMGRQTFSRELIIEFNNLIAKLKGKRLTDVF